MANTQASRIAQQSSYDEFELPVIYPPFSKELELDESKVIRDEKVQFSTYVEAGDFVLCLQKQQKIIYDA